MKRKLKWYCWSPVSYTHLDVYKRQILDGGNIIVTYADGEKIKMYCRFIDEYHAEIGKNTFHICEFAERMKACGATYKPADPPMPVSYTHLGSTMPKPTPKAWDCGRKALRSIAGIHLLMQMRTVSILNGIFVPV